MVWPAAIVVTPDGNTIIPPRLTPAQSSPLTPKRTVTGGARRNSSTAVRRCVGTFKWHRASFRKDWPRTAAETCSSPTMRQATILTRFCVSMRSRRSSLSRHAASAPLAIFPSTRTGDLFVADQGMRQILDFKAMGVPATGVTLLPPTPCATAPTVFCDQVIGSSDPTLPCGLFNNNNTAITGIGQLHIQQHKRFHDFQLLP